MNFTFSEEQLLLQRTLENFLENCKNSDSVWKSFGRLGFLAAPFAPEDGGHGASAVEIMIIMEAVGRYGVNVPYVSSVVLAGGFARRMNPRPTDFLGLLSGDIWTVGWSGKTVLKNGVLEGRKILVREAPRAKKFFITAHSAQGLCVCLVSAGAPGIELQPCQTVDGVEAATVTFKNTLADAVFGDKKIVEQVMDEGRAALCAEAAGAMRALYENTVTHCKTRHQFGSPLIHFQVVKHRLADMFMLCEEAFSMACLGAVAARDADSRTRAHGVSGALAFVSKAGRRVAEEAIQLHGAIGMSDEFPLGRYARRLLALGVELGDRDTHMERFMHSYPEVI